MKILLLASIALLAAASGAFADDIDMVFTPATQYYPPGYNPALCDLYGTAPCVSFSGTITDTDTDGSLLFLNSVTLDSYNNYFTVDNTFSSNVPGVFEGDTNDYVASNIYSGVILGLDIAPGTPIGTYTANALFAGSGGTNDPSYLGFTEAAQLTIIVQAPEPATGGLAIAAGLLGIAASRRLRRSRVC